MLYAIGAECREQLLLLDLKLDYFLVNPKKSSSAGAQSPDPLASSGWGLAPTPPK